MAANPKPPLVSGSGLKPYHHYHAEAHVLSGELKHPVNEPIEHHARVTLEEKSDRDHHFVQSVTETTHKGVISFKAGHSRVSGSQIKKKDLWGNDHSGWVTLSTSVIEGLNVLEVITADRVVAQVSTEHAMKDGHVPKVTFLGTRFENLCVCGYPVEVELDLGLCGANPPKSDRPYPEDRGFLTRVARQLHRIANAKGLPEDLEKQYDAKIVNIDALKKRANGRSKGNSNASSKVECSLIKSIGRIPIPGVKLFGNIIFIPDFGTVSLAEVEVVTEAPSYDRTSLQKPRGGSSPKTSGSTSFMLNMLNMQLGCIGGGKVLVASSRANGQTKP